VLLWSYGSFHDQSGSGGSRSSGGSGGDGATEGQGTGGAKICDPQADAGDVCCASDCGTCETCAADGSTCEAGPTSTLGPGCPGTMVCNALGYCVVPNGGACLVDGGACLSGNCVGSICCAAACTRCQTCADGGATCVDLAAGATDPDCPSGDICDGMGNCVLGQ
jgi:hypothetical protein